MSDSINFQVLAEHLVFLATLLEELKSKEIKEKLDDKDKQISSQEELLKNQEEQHKKDLERIAELEAKLNSINNSSNNI